MARRSRMVWGGAISLGLIAALLACVSADITSPPREAVRELFQVLTLVIAVLLPIVALVMSYLAIAGERESGGTKFLLAFPNTGREVFVGKLLSRFGTVAGGVGFIYVAALSVALSRPADMSPQSNYTGPGTESASKRRNLHGLARVTRCLRCGRRLPGCWRRPRCRL